MHLVKLIKQNNYPRERKSDGGEERELIGTRGENGGWGKIIRMHQRQVWKCKQKLTNK